MGTEQTDADLLARLWTAVGGDPLLTESVTIDGPTALLPSVYDVTAFAAATTAAAHLGVAELQQVRTGDPLRAVTIDRRHSAAAFRSERYLEGRGWQLPPVWDPIAGDYPTSDGWIRLHTNYAYHRDAVTRVLGTPAERGAVAAAVATWKADELETAVVAEGGCAAMMRTADEWRAHPQGQALEREPLADLRSEPATAPDIPSTAERVRVSPLHGIRVLDLTRVIAGPVCTRVLAGYGADVLRIDPPGFAEVPALLGDSTPGKRCAALDLHDPGDRATFERLVGGAHLLVHGYRGDALDRLGFDAASLRAINPSLLMVSHDAYGWSGPWSARRGFDSLVQMSCGIAARGQEVFGTDVPHPLPAQALDHGTGYLLAAAACRLLTEQLRGSRTGVARLSLARTAGCLMELGETGDPSAPDLTPGDAVPYLEDVETGLGAMRRVRLPGTIAGVTPCWAREAGPLGRDEPAW